MGKLILILGGARSGKSAYAQQLASALGGDRVLFVATAEAKDEEMRTRIEAHRQARPARWRTLEAPHQAGQAIRGTLDDAQVVLVDCLALLVSNAILSLGETPEATEAEAAVIAEVGALLEVCARATATFIIVSNEVGMGVVPPYPLGRLFRDLLGRANQMFAARADNVYLMIAGLPFDLKASTAGAQGLPAS